MTIITEFDLETNTWTHHGDNGARAAWREAVAEIAVKAKDTLPDCAGRVDRAVAIVLNHDVELLEDGKAKVASQSNGKTQYVVCNGGCECRDYAGGKAPSGWCKHRIAAGLYKRATALVQLKLAPPMSGTTNGQVDAPAAPEPTPGQAEVPVPPAPVVQVPAIVSTTLTIAGRQCEVKLCDSDDTRLLARLTALLKQYPVQAPQGEGTPQCPTHGAMKPSTRGRGWYCPVKLADGAWCKGR